MGRVGDTKEELHLILGIPTGAEQLAVWCGLWGS